MKRLLITGGLGYLGGRIADYLRSRESGTEIVLATRKRGEVPPWTAGMRVVHMDVLEKETLEQNLEGVDTVIHLAALNENASAADPEEALRVNTMGTYNLLDASVKQGVERFVYFSTFHVYGEAGREITEDTVARPRHPYSVTHLMAEELVRYFMARHGVKGLVLRLSNGFGYPMDISVGRWTLVFNDLCRQAHRDGRLVLKTTGEQHRDFITLRDVTRAVHHLIYSVPEMWGDGLFNLGGETSISILEAASSVARVYEKKYGGKIEIQKGAGGGAGGPVRFRMDKLKATGFTLSGGMEDEIDRILTVAEGFAR